MTSTHYYNEIDAYCAQWLQNLMDAGEIPRGVIDTRSIEDVTPNDVAGFTQCHFFAGIGGWPLAARLAGWPEDRELWTGSAPCQPFSVAGKQRGADDERHLWPELFRLISGRKPAAFMGEQVAAAVGKNWLDGVFAGLEGIGYACGAAIIPACAVDAPHRRDRLWFVADASRERCARREDSAARHYIDGAQAGREENANRFELCGENALEHAERARLEGFAGHGDDASGRTQSDRPIAAAGCGGVLADCAESREGRRGICRSCESAGTNCERASGEFAGCRESTFACGAMADTDKPCASAERQQRSWQLGGAGSDPGARTGSAWAAHDWIIGHDGKARRIPVAESGICLLAHGVPARVGKLRAYGNAIVPQVAAEVIAAFMECRPLRNKVSGSTIRPADMTGDSRGPDPCTSCAQALP